MVMVRLLANSRLPYASAETNPTVAITTTASSAIAKRRRKESADEGRSTRPRILLTAAVNIRTAPAGRRLLPRRHSAASFHRESQAAGEHESLDLTRAFADLED